MVFSIQYEVNLQAREIGIALPLLRQCTDNGDVVVRMLEQSGIEFGKFIAQQPRTGKTEGINVLRRAFSCLNLFEVVRDAIFVQLIFTILRKKTREGMLLL